MRITVWVQRLFSGFVTVGITRKMVNGHKSAAHTDSPDGGTGNTCLGGGMHCPCSASSHTMQTEPYVHRIKVAALDSRGKGSNACRHRVVDNEKMRTVDDFLCLDSEL